MSEKRQHIWKITDEYGEYLRQIKVVYYVNVEVCPACKGAGMLPYDNREELDFSESQDAPEPERPAPLDEPCHLCEGSKRIEKIDYKSMTPKQIETYEAFKKGMKNNAN